MAGDSCMYRLEGVSKVYGRRCVLDVPVLEVRRGEILGLVGPSGAGKSTLLRLLGFVESPTTGRLEFAGEGPAAASPVPLATRRRVAMVFQRPVLLSASVYANVGYGLQVRGVRNVRVRVEAALDRLGLAHLQQARAQTLSGGEVQRVALARVLVLEPDVLLLDEPTANLDPAHVALIEATIREVNEGRGVTVVLVTHNIFQARRLAHRVGLLVGGRLVEVAPTPAFFEAPQAPQTRAFVSGEMVY
jgi:tungstate transport system ATP-binding protein